METWEVAIKVLAEQGVSEANRAYISYSDRLQSVKILHAYTLKHDGTRFDVPPANFQEEVNKGRGKAAPMFSDLKTITVAFPEVSVGATVAMVYTRTQREATFPGNFSCLRSFSKFMTYDDAQVSISAPDSLKLQVEARGVKGGETPSAKGRRNWLWTYHSDRIATPEPGSVSALDYGPLIVASTFKDYGAVAAAYDARARANAVPDESIRMPTAGVTRNAAACSRGVCELAGANTIAALVAGANGPVRTVDFTMGAYARESFTFHLPDNVQVMAMPSDVQLKGKDATYSAGYQHRGNTVTVVRELDDMTPGNVCTPQVDTAFRPFALGVMKDLRAQILYK